VGFYVHKRRGRVQSTAVLAGVSILLLILKKLMILSQTNLGWNPVWNGLSFLNSNLIYVWVWWGGYHLASYFNGKKLEEVCELKRKHGLELQQVRSTFHEVEKELNHNKVLIDKINEQHRQEVLRLKLLFEKKNRSGSNANQEALRSFL
jgi:hypothetical protein